MPSVRLLKMGDEKALDDYLKPYTPFVYFLRSNVRRAGLSYKGRAYQGEYFGAFDKGELNGVLVHTWVGSVIVFAPELSIVPELAKSIRSYRAEYPREITCFVGPSHHVKALQSSLNIFPFVLRGGGREETIYSIILDQLIEPTLLQNPSFTVRRANPRDSEVLTRWRYDFYIEAFDDKPGESTLTKAKDEIMRRLGENDLFVLENEGEMVSFCGAGGFLEDWKHVGPVWTPVDKRGRGYARVATAGALIILRNEGATHASLFTSNPYAESAYRAIGFQPIGAWRLDFLIDPISRL